MNKINELIFDDHNANKGTARGRGMLEKSLSKYGAGRSILIDKNNRIIAGNKTAECAGEIGMDNIQIVESDGSKIIAVKRTDLDLTTDKAARELAFADNRVGQVDLEWSVEEIASAQCNGVDVSDFFTQDEIDNLTGGDNEEKEDKKEKHLHFSFSNCYNRLKIHGISFFALFRNVDMDLEVLKSDIKNAHIFIIPLLNYLKENKIETIILPPLGDRYKKNGFHFATELINQVSILYPLNILSPFEKTSKIVLKETVNIAGKAVIFDDIITFGTTIKNMNKLLNFKNNLILITNC